MKKLFIIIWAVFTTYIATAQAPEIEWENALNGSLVYSVMQTNDGGFLQEEELAARLITG